MARSSSGLRATSATRPRPPPSTAMRLRVRPPLLLADRTTEASTVTIPALPRSTSQMTIRRRTGWLTTDSASLVVNPTPKNADRAWNRATSRERPVCTSAEVPTRVISRLTETERRTAMTAATLWLFPQGGRDIGDHVAEVVVPGRSEGSPAVADGEAVAGAVPSQGRTGRVRLEPVHLDEHSLPRPHQVRLDDRAVEVEQAVDDRFGEAGPADGTEQAAFEDAAGRAGGGAVRGEQRPEVGRSGPAAEHPLDDLRPDPPPPLRPLEDRFEHRRGGEVDEEAGDRGAGDAAGVRRGHRGPADAHAGNPRASRKGHRHVQALHLALP